MGDVNSVILEGNLCRDVEVKYSNSGTAIASLSVAYNDSYKKGDEYVKQTHFFDVTAFRDVANSCAAFTKGQLVRIEGKLVQDRWEKDGKTQSKVKIIAFKVEAVAGHSRSNRSSDQPVPSKPAPARPSASNSSPKDFSDDIPF